MGRRGRVVTRGRAPQEGVTPLSIAAREGHLKVARALLQAGADITKKDNVSERRVGGKGQRIQASIDFGEF